MKYCSRCGTQLVDEAVVCTGCGCPVASTYVAVNAVPSPVATATDYNESGLSIAAKIFMIIGIHQYINILKKKTILFL